MSIRFVQHVLNPLLPGTSDTSSGSSGSGQEALVGPREPGAQSGLCPASQLRCAHAGRAEAASLLAGPPVPRSAGRRDRAASVPQPRGRAGPGLISAADAGFQAAGQASVPRHLERSWLRGCRELPSQLLHATLPPCPSRWVGDTPGSSGLAPAARALDAMGVGAEGSRPPRTSAPTLAGRWGGGSGPHMVVRAESSHVASRVPAGTTRQETSSLLCAEGGRESEGMSE